VSLLEETWIAVLIPVDPVVHCHGARGVGHLVRDARSCLSYLSAFSGRCSRSDSRVKEPGIYFWRLKLCRGQGRRQSDEGDGRISQVIKSSYSLKFSAQLSAMYVGNIFYFFIDHLFVRWRNLLPEISRWFVKRASFLASLSFSRSLPHTAQSSFRRLFGWVRWETLSRLVLIVSAFELLHGMSTDQNRLFFVWCNEMCHVLLLSVSCYSAIVLSIDGSRGERSEIGTFFGTSPHAACFGQ